MKGEESIVLSGIVLKTNVVNASGYMYTQDSVDRMFGQLEHRVKQNNAFGCFSPAEGSFNVIPLSDVSHKITEVEVNEEELRVIVKTLPTPKGKLLNDLINHNIPISFGSRGMGTINSETKAVENFELTSINAVMTDIHPYAGMI